MAKKIQEKLAYKEKLVEKRDRMLRHDFSTERATIEEVFDQKTLMVIYDFLNSGVLYELHGVVNAGKEARIYWGKDKDGKDLAVKIYLTTAAEFRKGRLKYIEGDYRFKGVKRDTRSLVFAWAQKEFKNLEQAYEAKVRVPKPIAVKDNVLVMEFIGKDGVNAPSLKEQPPSNAAKVYKLLLTYLERLYRKAELVHGDLSEYNILMWKGNPVLIDMAQAVPTSHPMAQFFLNRDLTNINRFFSRLGVEVLSTEEIYRKIVG
ncbi:MAG: serine protein kinase RIO [Candidatus Bathyarchaeota archaeon]|nr:serine protein kinase RIO [Candidatus Bathyarchaeota archaeon]